MIERVLRAALLGGLVGGAIDIGYAMIASYFMSGMTPDVLLRVVAGGMFGRDVIANGTLLHSAIGAALHFGICFVMALVFCTASVSLPALRRRWFVTGPLYGTALYVAMNYVVLPLSALAVKSHPEGWRMIGELISHMAGVGLSIAWFARRELGTAGVSRRG